jgi:hypothetical protein
MANRQKPVTAAAETHLFGLVSQQRNARSSFPINHLHKCVTLQCLL